MNKIETPRSVRLPGGAAMTWAPGFGAARTRRFAAAQDYVDREVLRRCAPYLPYDTGALAASGSAADGEVRWTAPYAAAQYYGAAGGRGKRGPRWFERMKIDHRGAIVRGAAAIAGGKVK